MTCRFCNKEKGKKKRKKGNDHVVVMNRKFRNSEIEAILSLSLLFCTSAMEVRLLVLCISLVNNLLSLLFSFPLNGPFATILLGIGSRFYCFDPVYALRALWGCRCGFLGFYVD